MQIKTSAAENAIKLEKLKRTLARRWSRAIYYSVIPVPEGVMPKDREVITFKADQDLLDAMKGISNRSAFIRHAILAALDCTCPLCNGTGVLTPGQRSHWTEFAVHHHIAQCDTCSEVHLVCDAH